ncbi:MAG: riboflavin biosynthesis protein RibF [bacterium]
MQIINNIKNPITCGSVCGLGNFDGLHKGHQKIIEKARSLASNTKKIGIITFEPPPVSVLNKNGIFYLTTRQEKETLLSYFNVDFVFYFLFDRVLAEKTPEEFVDLLYHMIQPSIIIVGENFHFGKGRQGTARLLKEIARGKFGVEIISGIKDYGEIISSTRIRELLLLGNIPGANRILGRRYSITGKVIKGKGKGSKLGFPTINLSVSKEKLLPLDGVYEVILNIEGVMYKGAMFLSHNNLEIYILNFSGNLYDREITVELIRRLRAIKEFPDDESLKKAIAGDVRKITAY